MIPRFIHSGMVGAPAMATAVSGALSVLNAALVDGFNVTAPNSVSASGGVVTFTYLVAHGYEDKCWVRVSGAGASALNADHQCTVPGSLTFTVAVPGIPDGPVSGSISVRVAPLGWERPFTATDVAVYRSPNVAGTRMFYRADDTNAAFNTLLRLRGYESMSSASVGTDPFPTVAQSSNGVAMVKGSATPWAVVGDDLTVYVYTNSIPQGSNFHGVMAFGDFKSYKPADAYAAMVGATNASNGGIDIGDFTNVSAHYVARSSNGLVKSPQVGASGPYPGNSGRNRVYPNVVSGGLTLSRGLHVLDGSGISAPVRGEWRGLMFVHEAVSATPWIVLPAVTGVTGRVVVMASGAGSVALPVDEDWL